MKKWNLTILGLLAASISFSQTVYERLVYNSNHNGDLENLDVVVTSETSTNDLVYSGYYYQAVGLGAPIHFATLQSVDDQNNSNFVKKYYAVDDNNKKFNTVHNALIETDDGFIAVGYISDNSFSGSTVPGGKDAYIMKCDENGVFQKARKLHVDGAESAWSIKQKDSTFAEFYICGEIASSTGSDEGFIMEIDDDLNLNWIRNLDLRINSSTETNLVLKDLVVNDTLIWAVGSLTEASSPASHGVVVSVSTIGNLRSTKRIYSIGSKFLEGVDLDGDDLVIVGSHKIKNIFVDRKFMIGFEYQTSTHTIGKSWRLLSLNQKSEGYDIVKSNSEYYCVGGTIDGTIRGVMTKLSSTFTPVSEIRFGGSGSDTLRGIETNADEDFLGVAGTYDYGGTYNEGYSIKTDLEGESGCSDSVAVDSASFSLNIATLDSSYTTTETYDTLDVSTFSLLDSTLCSDSISFNSDGSYRLSAIPENLVNHSTVYPNPVKQGETVEILLNLEGEASLQVFDLTGKQVLFLEKQDNNSNIALKTDVLNRGIYMVVISSTVDDNATRITKKLVVQ